MNIIPTRFPLLKLTCYILFSRSKTKPSCTASIFDSNKRLGVPFFLANIGVLPYDTLCSYEKEYSGFEGSRKYLRNVLRYIPVALTASRTPPNS